MSEEYTTAQMAMWRHVVHYVWLRWVVPVALLALFTGIVTGMVFAQTLIRAGWIPA